MTIYVQGVISDTAAFFAPLETAIRTKLIPALLEINSDDVSGDLRQVLAMVSNKGDWPLETQWTQLHMFTRRLNRRPHISPSHLWIKIPPFYWVPTRKQPLMLALAAAEIGF